MKCFVKDGAGLGCGMSIMGGYSDDAVGVYGAISLKDIPNRTSGTGMVVGTFTERESCVKTFNEMCRLYELVSITPCYGNRVHGEKHGNFVAVFQVKGFEPIPFKDPTVPKEQA